MGYLRLLCAISIATLFGLSPTAAFGPKSSTGFGPIALDASLSEGITVTFNDAVDLSSVTEDSVTLLDIEDKRVIPLHAAHATGADDLFFRADEVLQHDRRYQLIIRGDRNGIRSTSGAAMIDVAYDLGFGGRFGTTDVISIGPPELIRKLSISLSAEAMSTCATDRQHEVWCWGWEGSILGLNSVGNVLVPEKISNFTGAIGAFASSATAAFNRCLYAAPGWAAAGWFCWGMDNWSSIGHGGLSNVTSPTATAGLDGGVQVTHGGESSCMRYGDGTISCAGSNFFGQQGSGNNGGSNQVFMPIVDAGPFFDVASGLSHVCAVKEFGEVVCWGNGWNGELGDGFDQHRTKPVKVQNLTNVRSLALGVTHTCALLWDGTVKCWGDNSSGELGDGSDVDRWTPVSVKGLKDVVKVVAGGWYTCALTSAGKLFCWGNNAVHQLGVAGIQSAFTPIEVTMPDANAQMATFYRISAGQSHACAMRTDLVLWCWGLNNEGELGIGVEGPNGTGWMPTRPFFNP